MAEYFILDLIINISNEKFPDIKWKCFYSELEKRYEQTLYKFVKFALTRNKNKRSFKAYK